MNEIPRNFRNLQFFLGGARSGKSRLALAEAERLSRNRKVSPIFIATATADDLEMKDRIEKHKQERKAGHVTFPWVVVEEPVFLAKALAENDSENGVILVDCLTLWISNCLHSKQWEEQEIRLFQVLENLRSEVIFISNETGLGIVPMGKLTRQYVDASGFFHQRLAGQCAHVIFVVAGLTQVLKDER